MYTKFFNVEPEKQDRIINAAIKEFAQKGYDKASTNEIVKEAEISKGLLFHYFKNKKQLFLFLVDYCYETIAEEFYQKFPFDEVDFFNRMRQSVIIKMELSERYPDIFKFIQEAFMDDAAEIKPEMEKKLREMTDLNVNKIYEGVDYSKFRDDVDLQKILKIITWTFEKMSDEELTKAKLIPGHEMDYKKIYNEVEEYFEILKTCFYK
ncbi:TetR/AcrR family transcriptional regulator [Neobacillus niacini]|uniref:TetR/AcrR family transcriptional regulator n=1 Tax=Neobacillus niacini TaxID=86668 RepID=UPI0021CB449D|nr:TetR/AcrR family transcriptional regulator [Neobacillus niacini]MCM3764132.1 TetR/AcrR family transcriptional regulator [Neobacillus niacini]